MRFMKQAVVCVGDAGINGLATVRSLGRRGVPVHVVALESSAQIASASRYCRSFTAARDFGSLHEALSALPAGALLYVDNDPMLRALAPHAEALARRFALVDEIAAAARLTDKAFQLRIARQAGIAAPRTWLPRTWEDLLRLKTTRRIIAKPLGVRADFKALVAADGPGLAAALRGRSASPADVMVQEFVEGDDAQIFVALCYRARSRDQCFVLSARKLRQTAPGAGIMAVGQVVDAPQVREMTRRLAKAARARGVFCTEFKLDARDGRYYFIEWNPRPAYFQSIGWRSGFDLAWLAYCDHADPARLAHAEPGFSGEHYWISLQADLLNLSKAPRRAAAAWRPYVSSKEWAVFALDDLAPWRKSIRQLAAWLFKGRSFGRALARLAARRA
jgi:predicted ATP-grasp superfamily ATP-dependent carboligase